MKQADNSPCKAEYSLSYLVAKQYLAGDEITLGWDDYGYLFREDKKEGKRIDSTPLQGATVGYQKYDWGGYQLLLNYRNSVSPGYAPEILSFSQIISNEINVNKIKDKIVLIGYGDDPKLNDRGLDLLNTPIDPSMPGVVLHAHMISQLINLGQDPLFWYLPQVFENILIFIYALIGGATMLLCRTKYPFYVGIGRAIIPIILVSGVCYIFFLNSGWLPLGPFIVVSLGTSMITVGVLKKKYLLKQISALKAGR
jgi:CHASE2 domain-containing sensor protein